MRTVLGILVILTNAGLAAAQSAAPVAGDDFQPVIETTNPGAVGIWLPHPVEGYSARSVMIIGSDGRFATFVAPREDGKRTKGGADGLNAVSGSWDLADDGGEFVLILDNHLSRKMPGATRYLQMLLLGDELYPYPGMENRFPSMPGSPQLAIWANPEFVILGLSSPARVHSGGKA
ncbi:hypothetical protein [Aliihoeflea sp. 2WW]|uniref:hypothetical protein n=1 Tax=Aliihoeflea sp. 2WW TaxID=1381123 RepID=UPI001269602E|nr:hypothetical protein [Aliihoeflea sp. 2WW]